MQIKFKNYLLTCFVLAALLTNNCATARKIKPEDKRLKSYTEILSLLSKDEGFNEYMIKYYRPSIEYQKSLLRLARDYLEALEKYENKLRENSKLEKNYSNEWVIDIKKKYSKAYLIKNRSPLILTVSALYFSLDNDLIKKKLEKDALYNEYLCIEGFKYYFSYYFDYLDNNKITGYRVEVENFLKIINGASIRLLIQENGLKYYTLPSVTAAMNVDEDLFNFLKNHKSFSTLFDVSKAVEDIKILTAK